MADIWRVYEGREPTRGGPWGSLPLDDAVTLLELEPHNFVSDPSKTPRFGPQDRDLRLLGYKHIVVEVLPYESRPPDWKTGFYRSPVVADNALNTILHNALGPILGATNVLRVEHAPSLDSIGRNTLKVTAVITSHASRRITGDIGLRAVQRLQYVLAAFRYEGIPILQYATEDELADTD